MTKLLAPLKTRPRLAALGVVGAALCALPLLQLLRYQGSALDEIRARQQGLEPVAQTVAVQHGLVSHRDLAGTVLRGQLQNEPARQGVQRLVDTQSLVLQQLLGDIGEFRAREEAAAMHQDWQALAGRVAARGLAAADSDAAHRLLIEQALQVIDLVTLTAQASDPMTRTLTALARQQALPGSAQGAATLALLQALAAAHTADLQGQQQRLAQQRQAAGVALGLLAALAALLLPAALRPAQPAPVPPSAGALPATDADADAEPDGAATPPPQRVEAGRLIDRLRGRRLHSPAPPPRETSPTLPPLD